LQSSQQEGFDSHQLLAIKL